MIVSNHPQGTPEWKAERAGIATASEFAAVMSTIKSGESAERRNYRARLVVERLTGKAIQTFTSAAMRQGTEREPDARMAYMIRTGFVVDQVGFCRHDTLECGVSPDGLIGKKRGLEIKCPELATHLAYLKLKAEPPEYTWQIQGQMWVCELESIDFVSFNPDFPEHLQLIVRNIPRDEKKIAALASGVEKFMQEVRGETESVRRMSFAANDTTPLAA